MFISTLVPVGATDLQGSAISLSQITTATTDARSTTTTTTTTLVAVSAQQLPPTTTTTTTAPPTTTTTVPPFLSPVPPSPNTTKPVKVLLVGDSIAGSLGVGLAQLAGTRNVQIVNEGIPGCSLSMQAEIKVLFYTLPPGAPCYVHNNPDSLLDQWRKWVDAYNPDVVLYVARGETFTQEIGDAWENPGQPSFDTYLNSRYRQAADVLGSRGAAVVFMSTPYYSSGSSPAGTPWPEDAPSRVDLDNSTMRAVASAVDAGDSGGASGWSGGGGGKVYVYDLNAQVSPGHSYAPSIGGVNVRCNDGVHFSQSGGLYVGERLVPELVTLGQAHAVSSPGGAWQGRLPPSTPSWYTNLPCQ